MLTKIKRNNTFTKATNCDMQQIIPSLRAKVVVLFLVNVKAGILRWGRGLSET
jgi:hypothetical protein